MRTVRVYRFGRYNVTTDQMDWSPRLATKAAAQALNCTVDEKSLVEVDDSEMSEDIIKGVTVREPETQPAQKGSIFIP